VLCEGPLTLEYKEDKELDGFLRPLLGFWTRTKGHIQNQSCQEAITPGKTNLHCKWNKASDTIHDSLICKNSRDTWAPNSICMK
jgi:hypothetical protein